MSGIRVMHFSDTHFGVEALGRLDPATGLNTRLMDFRRTLEGAIEDALACGIHAVVFTGDAYRTRDPSQTHQREFAACIRRLEGIPVVLLPGNHDAPGVRGRATAVDIYDTLGVANVIVPTRPGVYRIETAAGPMQVAALPHIVRGFVLAREEVTGKPSDEVRAMLEERHRGYLDEMAGRLEPGLPTMLMAHVWIRDARLSRHQPEYFNPNEPQLAAGDVARPEYDYVALGHIHRHQDLNRGQYPSVVYAGSLDRIDFGEHDEDKGWVLVDLTRGDTRWEFVPCTRTRPFVDIEVAADNDSPTETIVEAIGRRQLRDAIVRLTYTVSADRDPLVRMRDVREALAPAFFVAGIRRTVSRPAEMRSSALTEALEPRAALERYLEHQGKTPERRAELLRYADALFDELRTREVAQ